jgi:hypothetical protein
MTVTSHGAQKHSDVVLSLTADWLEDYCVFALIAVPFVGSVIVVSFPSVCFNMK